VFRVVLIVSVEDITFAIESRWHFPPALLNEKALHSAGLFHLEVTLPLSKTLD
jgi:hypothetical protein